MLKNIDLEMSSFLLEKSQNGIAVFDASTLKLLWSNEMFAKVTRYGNAKGGKKAQSIFLSDYFAAEDFDGVKKLIEIAKKTRFSYDSEKNVRIGSKRFFPAELHFYWLSRKNF